MLEYELDRIKKNIPIVFCSLYVSTVKFTFHIKVKIHKSNKDNNKKLYLVYNADADIDSKMLKLD